MNYELANNLLNQHFPDKSAPQSISDWNGPFPLHPDLIEFYDAFGPLDLSLPTYGNDYFLPRLSSLWQYQQGYRWNALTGEMLPDWADEWLVIADQGADPFIFSRTTGAILFDQHGNGVWSPTDIFPNLEAMSNCLLTLASLVKSIGKQSLTNEQGYVKTAYQAEAIQQLNPIWPSPTQINQALTLLGWL